MHHSAQRDLRRPHDASARARGRGRPYGALLGFTLLASGVLGYWALSERPRSASPTDSARAADRQLIPDRSLPDPPHRVLDELMIELDPQGTAPTAFVLKRRRDGRQAGFYVLPQDHRADDAEVESLFSALLAAVAERQLRPPGDLDAAYGAYGVGEHQCRVRVRFGAGHRLCFGAESPSGSVYVRADHTPAILVVERGLFTLLSRPPERYQTGRMILVSLGNVHKLDWGSLHLVHDGDLWRVQRADGGWALAEPALVEALLQRLDTWSVAAWPTMQFDNRRAELPAAPSGVPLRLTVDGTELVHGGWPDPAKCAPGTLLFVHGEEESVCAEAPAARQLLPGWTELRAPRLLPLPPAQVTRLQVPGGVDVTRRPDGTYTQSGQAADTASVRRILALLAQSRPLVEAGAGLPPPDAVRLNVTTVLGQSIALMLWRSGAKTLVQRDREPAQLLDDSVAELFALTPLSFAPRQIVSLEPATVQRLSRRGTATEVLERATGWHLRTPTVAPADGAAVATLLAVLTDLRAERWVSRQPRPEYGLDPPRLRLAITSSRSGSAGSAEEEEKESASGVVAAADGELVLEVGGPAGEHGDCYGRRGGGPVAVLAAPTCATLTQPLLSARLLRLDEDRLTAVQLVPGSTAVVGSSCTQQTRRWQCGTHPLTAVAQRALLTALQAFQQGERPTYAAAPTTPPRWTLHLTHTPLGSATVRPSAWGPEAAVGEEVAPPEQTLRLYPAADGGFQAWLDRRGVTYHLPDAGLTALQVALAPVPPAPP